VLLFAVHWWCIYVSAVPLSGIELVAVVINVGSNRQLHHEQDVLHRSGRQFLLGQGLNDGTHCSVANVTERDFSDERQQMILQNPPPVIGHARF